jgi:hypothetical protein
MSDQKNKEYNTKPINSVNVTKVYLDANENKKMIIDYDDYMRGPGRFANASQIKMIAIFMNPSLHPKSQALAPGEYTKKQIQGIFGNQISMHAHVFHQASYDDHIKDKIERTYVWGSVIMKIHDSVKYVVEANGNRYLKNFALVPEKDNFDFQGGFISKLANPILERLIDPHQKGSTVNLNVKLVNVPLKTFGYQDYIKAQREYKSKSFPIKDMISIEAWEFIQHLKQQMKKMGIDGAKISSANLENILDKEKFYHLTEDKQAQAINLAIKKDELADLQKALAEVKYKIEHTSNQFGISPSLKAQLDEEMQQKNQQNAQNQGRSV